MFTYLSSLSPLMAVVSAACVRGLDTPGAMDTGATNLRPQISDSTIHTQPTYTALVTSGNLGLKKV